MRDKRLLAGVMCMAALALAAPAHAQRANDRKSHFGVIATMSPTSAFNDKLEFLLDTKPVDVKSKDLEIGLVVRGRHMGGDWGVSYVRKSFADGSVTGQSSESCVPNCVIFGRRDVWHSVAFKGVAIHKYVPFVTIKRRAQIGLTFGGGVAWIEGVADRTDFNATFVGNRAVQTQTTSQVDAKLLFLDALQDHMPLMKLEATAAALIAPGLKARVGAGFNYANYPEMSLSLVYLFGAK